MEPDSTAVVVFVHGSGSGRRSSRNRWVAAQFVKHRFATLLFDLLTDVESCDRGNVFDIELLSGRVQLALEWVSGRADLAGKPVGLFGAST
ncbi:MAG: alpha/beta hydrolase, partial [Rhizobacter sp.]